LPPPVSGTGGNLKKQNKTGKKQKRKSVKLIITLIHKNLKIIKHTRKIFRKNLQEQFSKTMKPNTGNNKSPKWCILVINKTIFQKILNKYTVTYKRTNRGQINFFKIK